MSRDMQLAPKLLLLAFLSASQIAYGATVHGSIVQRSIRDLRPVPNLLLTLRSSSNVRSARVYTDRSGEFYFYNVPPGKYVLEIWRSGTDAFTTATREACSLDVGERDIEVSRLRLHNSPLRLRPETRRCSEGLEHLYTVTSG